MTREEAKQELLNREPVFLDVAKKKINGHTSYICPCCGNGSGKEGTGIALNPNSESRFPQWKCFKCGFCGDVLELWKLHTGITDYGEAFQTAYDYYGIIIDQQQKEYEQQVNIRKQEQQSQMDYSNFFLEANRHLNETSYHRGISLDTLNRFSVGFVPNWRHPKAPANIPTSPRLIIPTSKYSYLARDTRENLPQSQKQYSKSKVGEVQIFNFDVLKTAEQPIFVVEGEIDALSIIDVGGEAIGLGSAGNQAKFVQELKQQGIKLKYPVILSLDADTAGQKSETELEKGLQDLGIISYRLNVATVATLNGKAYKDANERLNAEREQFQGIIQEISYSPEEAYRTAKEQSYRETFAKGRIKDIKKQIHSPENRMIPTGFKLLDSLLDGGLTTGLYVIGAISSLGKTTFSMQLCDQLASMGKDVLIFSLEMSASELIMKSISRITYERVLRNHGKVQDAKTYLGIAQGSRYARYSQTEQQLISDSWDEYENCIAERICIHEGIGNIGVKQIREEIQEHIKLTGETPVVLVDYLQILAPTNTKATDKQNIDKTVVELKRISRDFKTIVIGISSFNRESYSSAVSMASFKESGAIEYTSDVLIGLQLHGVEEKNFDVTKAKLENPRQIDLVILKNRKGITGRKILYRYHCMFNHFEEVSLVQDTKLDDTKSSKGRRSRREDISIN